jgi:hypothetical protein
MAFYVYNIQNCTTGGQIQAYTDALGASNLTPGQTVVKIGDICYSVLTYIGFQQTAPIGAIDMTQFTDPSLLWSDCASCINPTLPPSGGGGGGNNGPTQTFYYEIKACSELNNPTATVYKARRISQFADLAPSSAIKVGNVCFTVLTFVPTPANPQLHTFDITSGQPFPTCAECTAPPPPVWRVQYTLQSCANPNLTIQAYRLPLSTETPNVSFLSTGEIYKINNICYIIITAIWAQGPPDLSQPNVGNLSTFTTCQACNPQQQPIGTDGNGSPTALPFGFNCVNRVCQQIFYNPAAGDEAPPYTSMEACRNSGCQGYNCTTAGCVVANGTSAGTYTTPNCDNQCQTVNNNGNTPNYVTKWQCNPSTRRCQAIEYDPAIGETPGIYDTIDFCKEAGCQGYNCVQAGGCIPETGFNKSGQYTTLKNCTDNCQVIPNPTETIYWTAKLASCTAPVIDQIFGYSNQVITLGSIYRFSYGGQNHCYTVIEVTGFTTIQNNPGYLDLENKTIYANCAECNPTDPTDPCVLNPCGPGCPLDCVSCPNDIRCKSDEEPPKDPCDPMPTEPVQGDLLWSYVGGPGKKPAPAAIQQKWRINECWHWKYCACRSQPDPIKLPYVYEYKVCLCNDPGNDCPSAGSLVRYECRNSNDPNNKVKLEKWGVYNNGSCGTYDQLIESESTFCGSKIDPNCAATGTLIRTYCINSDKYGEYNDGKCGRYIERIEINSKECGYIDPPDPCKINPCGPQCVLDCNSCPNDPRCKPAEPPVVARVYYPIDKENTLNSKDITSFALWSNDTPYLLTPSTSSLQNTDELDYILHVYDRSPDTKPTCSAELQYNIIYADYEGKGATDLGGYDEQTLSKAMYTQYAHVLLPHGQRKFNFNGTDEDYVYIIDLARKRFKQSLDPGNWELTLASCSFSNDIQTDSILQDMFTASFNDATITFADIKTKRPTTEKPLYLSSDSYDILIGTIEDGIGTNYVTSSYITASLTAPTGSSSYIVKSNNDTNNTVIIQGTRAYYWGTDGTVTYRLTNESGSVSSVVDITPPSTIKNINPVATLISSSYTLSLKEIVSTYGIHRAQYEGSWTGSFALPVGATLAPTTMSGSCSTEIIYNSDFQLNQLSAENQVLEGRTFAGRSVSTETTKQQLTVNSVTYNGNLKWRTSPLFLEYLFSGSVPYNTPTISGSYEPNLNMVFVTDAWAFEEFVEDPTDPKDLDENNVDTYFDNYSDLDNGFILIPVRRTSYGRVYPSHGIIVLSGKKLDGLGFNTNRSIDRHGYNTYRAYHSLKMVLDKQLTDLSGDPLGFYARGVDIKHSSRYFVTLKNSHLNYSNNPTYVTGSEGEIRDAFIYQNKAYFSSIGLYNENRDLVAIGKISRPIMSSLTDEMLFTVKITK